MELATDESVDCEAAKAIKQLQPSQYASAEVNHAEVLSGPCRSQSWVIQTHKKPQL